MILVKYIINPIKYVTFHKLKGNQFILLLRLFLLFLLRPFPLGVTTVASILLYP